MKLVIRHEVFVVLFNHSMSLDIKEINSRADAER